MIFFFNTIAHLTIDEDSSSYCRQACLEVAAEGTVRSGRGPGSWDVEGLCRHARTVISPLLALFVILTLPSPSRGSASRGSSFPSRTLYNNFFERFQNPHRQIHSFLILSIYCDLIIYLTRAVYDLVWFTLIYAMIMTPNPWHSHSSRTTIERKVFGWLFRRHFDPVLQSVECWG